MRETWVRPLGWEDPLEKGKSTHIWDGLHMFPFAPYGSYFVPFSTQVHCSVIGSRASRVWTPNMSCTYFAEVHFENMREHLPGCQLVPT